jgi:AraC-like DNA-binding protein
MKRIFSTADVHPRDRFDLWHSVACATIVGHDSVPTQRQGFRADIKAGTLADIGVVEFDNSPMRVARTALQAAQADSDELFLCRQQTGSLAIDQYGRAVVLRAGDLTLLDPLMPYAADFSEQSQTLVLKMPRRQLEARLGSSRRLIGISIGSDAPLRKWVSCFAGMVPGVAGAVAPAVERVLQGQLLDLIAAAFAEIGASSTPPSSSIQTITRLNVHAAIEERLTDPTLDATKVANASGVSVRYANALLAKEGTSIMRLVLARRLERCKRTLEDPNQRHRTVSDIAYGWGFSDMTHFGREVGGGGFQSYAGA